ncbi:MAG: hypothetical protein US50_C0055G0001, partial [Candidatus Nomurabacteria bacterium GW2011_GWB1_37_5]
VVDLTGIVLIIKRLEQSPTPDDYTRSGGNFQSMKERVTVQSSDTHVIVRACRELL